MGIKTITLLLVWLPFVFARDFDGILGCRTTKLDLVFLIDGSGQQFNGNYPYVRQWIQTVTANFDVSPQTTRVAVVQKGWKPYEEFSFRSFVTTEEVLNAVNNIQYGTGSASTAEALSYTRNYVLTKARPDASVVVLILSNGEIRDPDEGYIEARKLHEIGVTTLAVGAGESFSNETKLDYLKALASHSVYDHTFLVGSLSDIGTLERSLIWEICKHTVQECPTAAHDLAFVIDSSSTIGHQNFQRVKSWMKKIVEAFDVGLNETRIAVIQYSTFVREEIRFNDGYSKSLVMDKIDQMTLIAGDTHTGHALEYCMRRIYSDGQGSRIGVPDVVIVMTDGKAQDHHHVINAARLLHEADIEVYAVGIGDSYSMEEIRDIASDPDEYHILHASTFRQIDFQRTGLIKRICEESEPGCPNTVADIAFLVDDEIIMDGESFSNIKTWMKGVVDYLEVGEHYSRISLVRFGALPEKIFDLQDYTSTSSVISVITRLPHQPIRDEREHSAIGVAIDYVKSSIFGHAERNVPRFMVIVTNGESRDNFKPAVERAQNAGIKIFSFGIGNVNLENLQSLASSPRYMFYEHSVLNIRRRIGSLMSELCRVSEPACAIQEIDLQFLVDGSDNIRLEDFEKVKRWIRNVIRSFDIGNYTTRVGIIKYGDRVQKIFSMDRYQRKREIEHAVSVMTPMAGKPRTGLALYHALNHGFAEEGGSRTGAAKVLVVISDGNSSDSTDKIIREIHQAGIRVFAVGAGHATDRHFLEMIATEPILTHVTKSSSYDAINIVRQQIVDEICRETKAECPKAEMDLIFLVDGSVGQDRFEIMKRWLVSFVSQFKIGEYNSKIGLVQISNSPRLEINLKNVSDKETLMKAILNMQHSSGEANIGKALEYVSRQGFSEDSRRNIPKVIVTLTGGNSRDSLHIPAWRLKNEGVIMYAVGVGDIRNSDLRSLASSNDNVLQVRNMDSISIIQSSLVRKICQRIQIGCLENNATDIVMLVDGSYSIGQKGWQLVKSFIRNITDRFEIGPHAVQLSLVQFASEPRIEFLLGEYDTWYSLRRAIRRTRWMTGDTHTARALRFARQHVLTPEAGSRPNVAKLLFIITDGSPQDRHEVNAAANAVKEYGWQIFAIGFDEASLDELSMMASQPKSDHVFYADNFDSTRLLEGRLFRMICQTLAKIPRVDQVTRWQNERLDPHFDVISRTNSVVFGKPTTSTRHHVSSIEPDFDTGSILKSTSQGAHTDILPGPISAPTILKGTNKPLTVRPSPWHNAVRTETVDPSSAPGLYVFPPCPILRTSTGDYLHGWDFLIEMGVVRSGTMLRRSNKDVIHSFQSTPTEQPYSITPGTSGNIKAYQISAGEVRKQLLSADFGNVFDSTWSFSVTLRTHFALNRTTWSLIDLSDSAGKSLFSIRIDDMEKTISVDIISGSIVKSVLATGDRIFPLFDRSFHKLEVIAGVNHITLKLDCDIVARSAITPPTAVYMGLLGSIVTSEFSGVTVDIQDMLFKCGEDNGTCYNLDGKSAGPGAITSDVNECTCPPGPQGPPGRSIIGKPGPRGPQGKKGTVKKATIRAVAKKVALKVIKGEFRRMSKLLLSSISADGTIDRESLSTALASLVAKGNGDILPLRENIPLYNSSGNRNETTGA